jgi:toxin YoeB
MKVIWSQKAFNDYQYFKNKKPEIFDKINILLKDISINKFVGLGKPEPLKHNLNGYWSRRINQEHRLVYYIKNNCIYVIQCKFHY